MENGSGCDADQQEREIKDEKTEQFLKNQVRNTGDSLQCASCTKNHLK